CSLSFIVITSTSVLQLSTLSLHDALPISATSTWRRSAIVMLASQDIEGPYEYVDTIIYSGFTSVDSTDGSERNTNYEATNLPDLIDDGTISEFNEEWVRNSGREYNTDYAPNAIDPAAFYDENGQLW